VICVRGGFEICCEGIAPLRLFPQPRLCMETRISVYELQQAWR
jgi:hypothetical protein